MDGNSTSLARPMAKTRGTAKEPGRWATHTVSGDIHAKCHTQQSDMFASSSTALERDAKCLRASNDDTPSTEIEIRHTVVAGRAASYEHRRQELPVDLDTSERLLQPPPTEIQARVESIRRRQKSRQQAAANLNKDIQPELDFLNGIGRKDGAAQDQKLERRLERERSKLLPARYTNGDFFVADIFGYSMKDDAATMEAPVFSLKTQKDFSVWEWTSKDGTRHIEVSPSVKYGRATMHDKSVLIFVTSVIARRIPFLTASAIRC